MKHGSFSRTLGLIAVVLSMPGEACESLGRFDDSQVVVWALRRGLERGWLDDSGREAFPAALLQEIMDKSPRSGKQKTPRRSSARPASEKDSESEVSEAALVDKVDARARAKIRHAGASQALKAAAEKYKPLGVSRRDIDILNSRIDSLDSIAIDKSTVESMRRGAIKSLAAIAALFLNPPSSKSSAVENARFEKPEVADAIIERLQRLRLQETPGDLSQLIDRELFRLNERKLFNSKRAELRDEENTRTRRAKLDTMERLVLRALSSVKAISPERGYGNYQFENYRYDLLHWYRTYFDSIATDSWADKAVRRYAGDARIWIENEMIRRNFDVPPGETVQFALGIDRASGRAVTGSRLTAFDFERDLPPRPGLLDVKPPLNGKLE